MSIVQTDHADLPDALREQVLSLARRMLQAVMQPNASAAEAEEQVRELSCEIGQAVLSTGLSARFGQQEGTGRACECGHTQRFESYRSRQVMTTLGPVSYRRAYYRCRSCRATHYVGDAALGLVDTKFSLPAQEAISLVSSEVPFERVQFLLSRLSSLRVSISHAQQVSQDHGTELLRVAQRHCDQLFAGQLEALPESREHRLYVTLDATKTRLRDDWHETKLGAVYDVKAGRDRMDEPLRTTYVTAVHSGVEHFGRALYQEAARRGVEHAAQVVVVADGAPWIWNLAAEHFPGATQILDFYHASERIHTVARAVYGEGTRKAKQWAEGNVARLREGNCDGLLRSLRALEPRTQEGREQVRLAIGYFTTNRCRMNYPSYRAQRMHIGSGVVEAGCKHVVGARCKRAGMRWTKQGADTVLALRTLSLNQRWEEYWNPIKRAA